MQKYYCPICATQAVFIFNTYFTAVAKCCNQSCGHLHSISSNINIGIHEHHRDDAIVYDARNKKLVNKLKANGFLADNLKILDIGSGLGHILQEIKVQIPSVEVVCLEAAPQSIAELRKKGFNVMECLENIKAEYLGFFDRVLLIEVIEHIDRPAEMFSECFQLLRAGGQMLITTPSGELRWENHDTAAYKVREHVQFFTKSSLRLAIKSAGFKKLRFKNLREYYCGPKNSVLKLLKDFARFTRNMIFGRHHFVVLVEK